MSNEIRVRSNFAAGALSATLSSGGTTMTSPGLADLPAITSADHAAIAIFTADGDGRVITKEIVHVSAHTASATTATIVRGREGTTAAGWAIGDKWEHAPTAADHIATVDQPWGGDLGDDYEFNGTTTSLPSGWSWINQGSSTYAEDFGAGRIVEPARSVGSHQWRCLVRAVPASTPWTVTMKLSSTGVDATTHYSGLVLQESGTGELYTLEVSRSGPSSSFFVERWTSPSAFLSTAIGTTTLIGRYDSVGWYRVRKNSSTSWDFELSADGVVWYPMALAHDLSSFMTPDRVGFGLNCFNNGQTSIACHWYRAR